MIVATMPSTGVMWSLPSRRGRSYPPDSAASAIRAWNAAFETVRAPLEVDVDHAKRRRQRLRGIDLAGRLVAEARERAQVRVPRRVDEDRRPDATEARPGRDHDRLDPAVADLRILEGRVQQHPPAGLGDAAAPRRP